MAYNQVIQLDAFPPGAITVQSVPDVAEFAALLKKTGIFSASTIAEREAYYQENKGRVGGFCSWGGKKSEPWLIVVIQSDRNKATAVLAHEATHLGDYLCGTGNEMYETKARIVEEVVKRFLDKYKGEADGNWETGIFIMGGAAVAIVALIVSFFWR